MALPDNSLTDLDIPVANWLTPDDIGRPADRKTDYEEGGAILNDPNSGLQGYIWRATLSGNDVLISRSPYDTSVVLLTDTDIEEISLSFDQNMRPTLAYVSAGQAKLYWYDSALELQVTTNLATDVRSPFLSMDDKRETATTINSNDTLLFYIRGSSLYYRQQRERYNTERLLRTYPDSNIRIGRAGITRGLRMQVQICYITEPTP